MAPGSNSASRLRAITAVIALYAFVLQAFLGGLMPAPILGDGHVLCLSSSPASGDPSPDRPHVHADCCTAVHVAAVALAPGAAAATLAWPRRRVANAAFPREAANGARAPPHSIAHPRGPPVV